LAATPFKHDVLLGDSTEQIKVGSVKHLPPTFSFQYHFMPDSKFRPYVGLGPNYTTFFDETLIYSVNIGYTF
jgi:outer membrane protein